MQIVNLGEWFTSMRKNCLPLTILLVLFPSQISIGRTSDAFSEKIPYLLAEVGGKQKLDHQNIPYLRAGCIDAAKSSSDRRLRELGDELMRVSLVKNSFEFGIEIAEALLVCKAPDNAQKVLMGIIPISSPQQKIWSILSWQASNAVMDHVKASFALRKLSGGNLQKLDEELITVGYRADGSPLKRLALDLLAEHERLIGRCDSAARVLLAGRLSGAMGAKRLARAAQCLKDLNMQKRKDLLELALAEAKADQAWWLVGDILRLQLVLDLAMGEDAKSTRDRLESFAKELDDRYTQLELIRFDPNREDEKTRLKNQLRSPREKISDIEKNRL